MNQVTAIREILIFDFISIQKPTERGYMPVLGMILTGDIWRRLRTILMGDMPVILK
jgi:hypothetical protein